ncbi:hypothetical protein AgCh_035704 [Apium graveolens]
MGFSKKWIDSVMMYVKTVTYPISFQGSSIGPIIPKRGLRQGDPLSPYLFLLCVEGLSLALKISANRGDIHGCCISQSGPAVTHLLFADDSFLFFKATTEETKSIKQVLNAYEDFSGQAVNYLKSAVFLSANVRRDKQVEIKDLLGVINDIAGSKYLGVPSLIGRSMKTVFRFLKDKEVAVQSKNNKVCDFFVQDKKECDADKVRSVFNRADVNAILSTRIPQNCTTDKLAWVHSNDEQYTVKMGYQQWHNTYVGSMSVQQSVG